MVVLHAWTCWYYWFVDVSIFTTFHVTTPHIIYRANVVTLEELNPASFFDESISNRLRAWLFVAFLFSFGAIAAAIWLMAAVSLIYSIPLIRFLHKNNKLKQQKKIM